jgi:hypothetical protein
VDAVRFLVREEGAGEAKQSLHEAGNAHVALLDRVQDRVT